MKRKNLESLHSKKLAIEAQMREIETELESLDQEIDTLELEIAEDQTDSVDIPTHQNALSFPQTNNKEDSTMQPAASTTPTNAGAPMAVTQQLKENKRPSATLDTFLGVKRSVESPTLVQAPQQLLTPAQAAAREAQPATRPLPQHPSTHLNCSGDPKAIYSSDSFPWSQQLHRELSHTFRISAFRENQREIINATLSGVDVFCVMRTYVMTLYS